MSIFGRLFGLVQDYFAEQDAPYGGRKSGDALYEESLDELENFLRGEKSTRFRPADKEGHREEARVKQEAAKPVVPDDVQRAFAELGLPSPSDAETCKAAYKKLLKLHHPDRHAGHEGNMKKATEKSARINAAYEKICDWHIQNCHS